MHNTVAERACGRAVRARSYISRHIFRDAAAPAHTTATTATTTRAAAAATATTAATAIFTHLEVVGLRRVLDEVSEAALSEEALSLSVRCLCLQLSDALPQDS